MPLPTSKDGAALVVPTRAALPPTPAWPIRAIHAADVEKEIPIEEELTESFDVAPHLRGGGLVK